MDLLVERKIFVCVLCIKHNSKNLFYSIFTFWYRDCYRVGLADYVVDVELFDVAKSHMVHLFITFVGSQSRCDFDIRKNGIDIKISYSSNKKIWEKLGNK